MKKIKGTIYLLCAALLWGVAFVAQDVGLEHIEPFTFTSVRCFLGADVLFFICLILNNTKKDKPSFTKAERKKNVKNLIVGSLVCGTVMCLATNLQQIGLVYTTAGKSGFITACYIVLVPVIGLFLKRKCPLTVWIAVMLAVTGLYFLCLGDGIGSINKGDLITLGCTVMFSLHILVIDAFIVKTDAVCLACGQCLVNSIISAVFMFIFENPSFQKILNAIIPLVYTGVFSAGVAYMFQILGQKFLKPTVASIIMSLESVISVLAAWVILNQALSIKEIIGCVVIFCAIILAQIQFKKKDKGIKTLY